MGDAVPVSEGVGGVTSTRLGQVALTRLHQAQLLTYLRLSDLRLGLLINFNADLFKNGSRRLVL